jgi:(4-O-methyl)-D-glucuronate---lignin esterase
MGSGLESEIDRRLFLQYLAAAGLASATPVPFVAGAAAADTGGSTGVNSQGLAKVFANPPPGASPGAYWYWLGGNVTREGITADLEAMRAAGIWNPVLFAIGKSGPDTLIQPPADALTPLWWEMVEHAANEAERLGLILSLNCCDGWATASGPWITPELSMQHVVWSETTVAGGRRFDEVLPRPPAKYDYYREIATIAVPCPPEWDETSFTRGAQITSNLPLKVSDAQVLSDPDNVIEVVDTPQSGWIGYAFEQPFTLRSVRVHTPPAPGFSPGVYRAANSLEVQASDDGKTFRRIGSLEYPRHGWQTDLTTLTHAVPRTTARYFRLVHTEIPSDLPYEEEYDFGQDNRLRLFSVVLSSEPRIHHLQGKSAEVWAISRRTTAEDVPDSDCVRLESIVDLSSKLDVASGRLAWDAPAGRWRVLRVGYTTTGSRNSAAGGAQGLECDRFSPRAARLQFDSWFGLALQKVGARAAGKVLHVLHVDSWEAGSQNWSPEFAAGFARLRGYDLLPYIAVLTGVPVTSADVSERVLLDLRRTINDLMQAGFYGPLAQLTHEHGCLFSGEPPNPTFPSDGLEYAARIDWPMGEFWLRTPRNDKPTDIKDAVSGARVYGKRIAAAEAFTQGRILWNEHPFTFKQLGDRKYCAGINRLMLHLYAHQPWLDRAPGITLSGIGTFFSRTQTWWRPGKAWFDYLRRSQSLLQEGLAVADVCYFTGENIPARSLLSRQLSVPLPDGYAYDCINRDALLHLADVRDGWIVLKSGARYRVLVLPDEVSMTPEIALKLRELVRAGAVVLGPRPRRSPSLMGFPGCDATVREVAEELWGLGRVVSDKSLDALLAELDLTPDVRIEAVTAVAAESGPSWNAAVPGEPPEIDEKMTWNSFWTHRRGPDWDLYFIANPLRSTFRPTLSFRVTGREAQVWHADRGEVIPVEPVHAGTGEEPGRTSIGLQLDPAGAVFVFFGGGRGKPRHPARPGYPDAPPRPAGGHLDLAGPWRARFTDRLDSPLEITFDKLVSWSSHTHPDVKYYSGTATYILDFAVTPELLKGWARLDLGEVRDLVEVRLNDIDLGVLWKPRFEVAISQALRVGQNKLELAVTNTWRNRIIGDYGKPDHERKAFVVPRLRKGEEWLPGGPGTELSPAGLLGPVKVVWG